MERGIYCVDAYYFATGEGTTTALWAGYANDPEHAKELFVEAFGELGKFLVKGCDVEKGIPTGTLRDLFPKKILEQFEEVQGLISGTKKPETIEIMGHQIETGPPWDLEFFLKYHHNYA